MQPKDALTHNEQLRYSRQTMLNGDIPFNQEKLKAATVFVAGAGGLGSPVLYYLAAAGVGRLIICDRDKVELSNLNRQILHGTPDIGIAKAASAENALKRLNPEIEVTAVYGNIEDYMERFARQTDIYADCLDSIDARYKLGDFAVSAGKPVVHGGINGFAGQVSFLFPPETPCFRCLFPDPRLLPGPVPVIGAAAGFTGALQALEIIKYLTGTGSLLKNRLLIIDGLSGETSVMDISRPGCPHF